MFGLLEISMKEIGLKIDCKKKLKIRKELYLNLKII
jgi:hypothetical protein